MKTRLAFVLAVLLAASLACDTSSTGGATEKDLSGTYVVSGTNFGDNTDSYTGEATIAKVSGNDYSVIWTIGESQTQTGSGTLSGNTFTVTWKEGDISGGGTYTLQSDGSLDGIWTVDGVDGQGTETFTPK